MVRPDIKVPVLPDTPLHLEFVTAEIQGRDLFIVPPSTTVTWTGHIHSASLLPYSAAMFEQQSSKAEQQAKQSSKQLVTWRVCWLLSLYLSLSLSDKCIAVHGCCDDTKAELPHNVQSNAKCSSYEHRACALGGI